MRRATFRVRRPAAGVDDQRILPLVNVVFLLLIFFMLAGKIAAKDAFPVHPPLSEQGGQAEDGTLLLLIGPDGQMALDGEPVDRAGLPAALARRPGTGPATVKADGQAPAATVIEALAALRAAGHDQLRLLAAAKKP